MMVLAKALCKSYSQGGRELKILSGLDLAVDHGESIAIVGQSGSGKSTLLSLLAGLDQADSGSLVIADQEIVGMNSAQAADFRSQNIGIVFQQFHLLQKLRAWENIALPLEIKGEKNAEQKARELMHRMRLSDRQDHFPAQLSGGECQRVAMARAIIARPRLLLADEPSGNLDPETAEIIMKLYFEILAESKITSILVTHSHALAAQCGRCLRLLQGQLT
jgi:putative ABC transport system ATP-binding protein